MEEAEAEAEAEAEGLFSATLKTLKKAIKPTSPADTPRVNLDQCVTRSLTPPGVRAREHTHTRSCATYTSTLSHSLALSRALAVAWQTQECMHVHERVHER